MLIRSGHNFAFVTTAQLSWHVLSYVLTSSLESWLKQKEFLYDFILEFLRLTWPYVPVSLLALKLIYIPFAEDNSVGISCERFLFDSCFILLRTFSTPMLWCFVRSHQVIVNYIWSSKVIKISDSQRNFIENMYNFVVSKKKKICSKHCARWWPSTGRC